MPSDTPRLALTVGEPSGIGPDLCVELAFHEHPFDLVVIGDPSVLEQRAFQLGKPIKIDRYDPLSSAIKGKGRLRVDPVNNLESVQPGHLNAANSSSVLAMLDRAITGCLSLEFDAMVTAPVQKSVINEAGYSFSGHTEYIAEKTGGDPVMMLATPGLRVALATTHLPLSKVSAAITTELLRQTIHTIHQDMTRHFGLIAPKIVVCGLNPHAGENGHLGHEEIETLIPAIKSLQAEGINVMGPLAADTVFTPKYLDDADIVLAMYHDQGLPVLKHLGFGQAVNVTLGLPILRTSVDHGTALDLAGTGQANPSSLFYALETAYGMIKQTVSQ